MSTVNHFGLARYEDLIGLGISFSVGWVQLLGRELREAATDSSSPCLTCDAVPPVIYRAERDGLLFRDTQNHSGFDVLRGSR